MTLEHFVPIQTAKRRLAQRQETDVLERVFLYGSWEELWLMQDFIYCGEPIPYGDRQDFSPNIKDLMSKHIRDVQIYRAKNKEQIRRGDINLRHRKARLYTWHDAESVTQTIAEDMSDSSLSKDIMDYQSLRVLGAGIQNVLTLYKWVAFLKKYCDLHHIQLSTFAFFHTSPEEHCGWFREETKDVVHKTKTQTFVPEGSTSDRTRAKMPGKIIHRGVLRNSDQLSEYQNVIEGIRKTRPNVIDGFEATNHFFGASEIFGTHLVDADTIPSCFAKLSFGANTRVLNYGMGGVNFIDVIMRIMSANIAAGDTIFLALPFCAAAFSDVKICLDGLDFFDQSHVTPSGAKKIATALYDSVIPLNQNLMVQSSFEEAMTLLDIYKKILLRVEANEYHSQPIESYCNYLSELRQARACGPESVIGSVAVNCNPMTNGHRYLIDYARQNVDFLYVFVIEEDKSAVKFTDRFEMVKLGCADFDNVHVIRGGQFVCTEYIAPEYFVKDEAGVGSIDFGLESFYFGNFISPALDIKKIFLGEEPICQVTAAYNAHMVAAMPQYQIDLTIIPRKSDGDGQPISASRVRSLIQSGQWDKVSQLVPPRVYTYMRENNVLEA